MEPAPRVPAAARLPPKGLLRISQFLQQVGISVGNFTSERAVEGERDLRRSPGYRRRQGVCMRFRTIACAVADKGAGAITCRSFR